MAVIDAYYTYRHNTFRVWTSTTLGTVWNEAPYLRVESLNVVAAPDIDTCLLSYRTGQYVVREADQFGNAPIVEPTWFNALDLNRHFVKVELLDLNNNGDDGQPAILYTWYGVIELDERDEAQKPDEAVNRTGLQALQAFGLLRLLETTIIASSVVENESQDLDAPETVTIGRGLPFNLQSRGSLLRRGNVDLIPDDDGVRFFSSQPFGDEVDGGDFYWDASDAVRYLLKHHRPKDQYDDDLCDWVAEPLNTIGQFGDEQLPCTFYDVTVETDRRNVKSVLDDLLDRRRMVGYRVYGRETDTTFEAVLHVFSFNAEDIPLEGGEVIPANDTVEALLAGSSTIVSTVKVRQIATHQIDELIVEGAPPTTTFTLGFGNNDANEPELAKGWTNAQETAYLAGASGSEEENAAVRSRDGLRDVFARFLVPSNWTQRVVFDNAGDIERLHVAINPEWVTHGDASGNELRLEFLYLVGEPERAYPIAFHVKRFLDLLPIKDPETNEYRRPFVALTDGDPDDPSALWAFAENVSLLNEDRRFNCSLRMLPDHLGFYLEVSRAGGQQLIAKNHWSGAEATAADVDPATAEGLDYEVMRFTGTLEWDVRVFARRELNTPTGQKRILRISIPDARLDVILPGTVEDIADDGTLQLSAGEKLKDDRPRLEKIADAAAAWYGSVRQALTISFRELDPKLEIGTLLTRLWGVSGEPINTPVTGIRFDARQGTTTIETAYAEIDFSTFATSASGRYS